MARVSIIIPCFNRDQLLGATLDSIRAQTFPDWEAIVVDDSSWDQSVKVAERYVRLDSRFRAISRRGDTRGANAARNLGLYAARGEYVLFVDSDDLLSPTCLEQRVASLAARPDCGFGIYQAELFSDQIGDRKVLWNAYTEINDLHRFLSLDTVWDIAGPIWRRKLILELGGFDEHLPSFQDWAISVRALIAGTKYFKAPIRDHFYRTSPSHKLAISKESCVEPCHLRSHQRLFEETLSRLRSAGLLDREIQCRVTGQFWWLSKRWNMIGRIADAERVWFRAFELGLCSRHQYYEGRVIFRLNAFRGGGRLARFFQLFWPPHFYQVSSKFFHNAPLDLCGLTVAVGK